MYSQRLFCSQKAGVKCSIKAFWYAIVCHDVSYFKSYYNASFIGGKLGKTYFPHQSLKIFTFRVKLSELIFFLLLY